MAKAKLNDDGQLVSEANEGVPPIIVISSKRVDNLNVEKLNGKVEADFLRTNDSRTLTSTLTVEGTGKINISTGKLAIDGLELKASNGVLYVTATED